MSYWDRACDYADAVDAGDIPAGPWVRAACKRFIADTQRTDIYAHEDGNRWCKFLERLPHVKGRWAAKAEKFLLSDWQIFCTVNLYGWKREDGLRRFREGYIEVPRKNGKSFWVAGLGVGHLCIDKEFGAEVYCGATSEKQAWEVFRPARWICERHPDLMARFGLEPNARAITQAKTGSRFEPVIGSPGDGASPSMAIADEFHEHRNGDLVETFTTGMGSREQPMMIYITTAGSDMGGPCYEKRADVLDILKGTVEDDRIFGIVYGLDDDDDWDTIDAQKKANPNYGVSISADFLEGQLVQARRSAASQNSYKTKHLNQWVGAKQAWMNMLALQRCRKRGMKLEDFKGERCIAAVDLASKIDIACLALLFQRGDEYFAFVRHYLPEDRIEEVTRYREWHTGGWLTATPGNIIDFAYIEKDLQDLKSDHEVAEVAYDPFQATQFATRMYDEGFPMLEYGATVKNFSEPMKQLEALILQRKFWIQADPVLYWMFGNVVAQLDAKDNIFPRKEKRHEVKIDGVVALIMALARAMYWQDSVYEERGLRVMD